MQTGTEVVAVLGKAWHIIQCTPTIAPTGTETKTVRGPALHPHQPDYRLMLVSRCIPYWASVALYFLLGKYRAVFLTGQVGSALPLWARSMPEE
jgi:hypothetical protein